jgi:hypothetical protein
MQHTRSTWRAYFYCGEVFWLRAPSVVWSRSGGVRERGDVGFFCWGWRSGDLLGIRSESWVRSGKS